MRWKQNDGWRRRFALLPLFVSDEVVWLQTYWARPRGEYTEVRFTDPRAALKDNGHAGGAE